MQTRRPSDIKFVSIAPFSSLPHLWQEPVRVDISKFLLMFFFLFLFSALLADPPGHEGNKGALGELQTNATGGIGEEKAKLAKVS